MTVPSEESLSNHISIAKLLATLEDVAPFPAADDFRVLNRYSSLAAVNGLANVDTSSMPLVVALIGPSGVGQDSILASLASIGYPFSRVRTATSRPMRDGESEDAYIWMEHPNTPREHAIGSLTLKYGLLECEHYGGAYYGTPIDSIFDAYQVAPNQPVIVKNDINGADNIKKKLSGMASVMTINLVPENYKNLWDRTHDRSNKVSRIIDAMRYAVAGPLIADYTVINATNTSPDEGAQETASLVARLIDKLSGQ